MKQTSLYAAKCSAHGGEGHEVCEEAGLVEKAGKRETSQVHPDGVSKVLEARRIACGLSFEQLGMVLGIPTERAIQLCRGEEREWGEYSAVARFILPKMHAECVVGALACIGDGNVWRAENWLMDLDEELEKVRKADPWPENASDKYQALGRVHAAYQDLARAVERKRSQEFGCEAQRLIATALRCWLGEHQQADHH